MKKIGLVLIIAAIWFGSCGERYEEERGSVFEGTWTLLESYVDTVQVSLHRGKFLIARKFEGENLLLFYTGGRYDSSFFFRLDGDKLFVRRVLDSVDVLHSYYLTDSTGNAVLDSEGNKIFKIDTIREAWKPLNPKSDYSPEKYYGTCSFNEGVSPRLTISRYFVDSKGVPIDKLYGRDIYERPVESE
ncbi:MAG: hypothetical protein LBD76_08880 [Prevotellaceae bacterium]|jgi:hypothetical protein|nr:hypothetical protein [Prevotellaceae bacterium]